jgi:hypothetical protein
MQRVPELFRMTKVPEREYQVHLHVVQRLRMSGGIPRLPLQVLYLFMANAVCACVYEYIQIWTSKT